MKKIQKNEKVEVSNYSFNQFNEFDKSFKDYEFHDFNKKFPDLAKKNLNITDEKIRSERVSAKSTNFEINSDVQLHRGMKKQENDDFTKQVETEVAIRLSSLKVDAEKAGFEKGFEKGQIEAYDEAKTIFDQKIEDFAIELESIKDFREEVMQKEMQDSYLLIKNLSKWIVLKEIDEDDKYLTRLLERLILELNEKKNLLVRVNANYFAGMDEVLETIQQKVGKLTNVRVEIDQDINDKGIILESDKGIIDGTLKAQFQTFQKIFETVGIVDNETKS